MAPPPSVTRQQSRTVSGLDVSQKMLDHARANTEAAQVSYFHADLKTVGDAVNFVASKLK